MGWQKSQNTRTWTLPTTLGASESLSQELVHDDTRVFPEEWANHNQWCWTLEGRDGAIPSQIVEPQWTPWHLQCVVNQSHGTYQSTYSSVPTWNSSEIPRIALGWQASSRAWHNGKPTGTMSFTSERAIPCLPQRSYTWTRQTEVYSYRASWLEKVPEGE